MSIKRDIKMIINGDKATSDNVYVYKNDHGIELHITIEDKKFLFDAKRSNVIKNITNDNPDYEMYSQVTILKPNDKSYMTYKLPIFEDKVVFKITKDITDELDEIGLYTMQIHLFDAYENRVTMPPIMFEVKELIAEPPQPETGNAAADGAMADIFKVAEDGRIVVVQIGDYVTTLWQTGDLISSVRLNKIEGGISGATLRVADVETTAANLLDRMAELEAIKNRESYVRAIKVTYVESGV